MPKCKKCDSEGVDHDYTYQYYDVCHCLECDHWTFHLINECCRNPYLIVVQDHKYPMRTRLYYQCLNCFGCLNRTKPLPASKFGRDIEAEFANHRFEEWIKARKEEAKWLSELVRRLNYEKSHKKRYDTYISSYEWKEKRKLVLERDGRLCQGCKNAEAYQVHHLTYDRLFNELLQDLISLCNDCHEREHRTPFLNLNVK